MTANIAAPGAYIDEVNAFPNSVVPVATAVPAFIGYTPKAEYQGKSRYNQAIKITSFADFRAVFMLDDPSPPADPARQYQPEYYLVPQNEVPTAGDYLSINGQYHSILPDPNTIYHLYNSVRLFYQNGGGEAYIVAVGPYGPPSKKPLSSPSASLINPNVQLSDLQRGLALLKHETEPTIYVCPDATLLSIADNGMLMQSMLSQAEEMQTVFCLFDVIGGFDPDPLRYTKDIQNFRDHVGNRGLKWGASYYPYIGTTVMGNDEIDFTNLFGGNIGQLATLIDPSSDPNPVVREILASMQATPTASSTTDSKLHEALQLASPIYQQIVSAVLDVANRLPPGGALAGVYSANDNLNGVWDAPANTSIVGAVSLPIRLSDSQQAELNVDAVSGKSINAIRFFNGQGVLIWGARTLDGNSEDWRYISVSRTAIFLEQSVKTAMQAYVFEPNNANTWSLIRSTITSFLTDVWKQGGLQGANPSYAFEVSIGLGTTMSADDVLNGIMRVSMQVALVRPAEFILITIDQQQTTQN